MPRAGLEMVAIRAGTLQGGVSLVTQSVLPIVPPPLLPPPLSLRGAACWVIGSLMTGWEGAFLYSEGPGAHLPLRQTVI